MKDVITHNEIKFWMGVMAVIGTVLGGFYSIKIEITEMRKDIQYLSQETEKVNQKFSGISLQNLNQEVRISSLETIISAAKDIQK